MEARSNAQWSMLYHLWNKGFQCWRKLKQKLKLLEVNESQYSVCQGLELGCTAQRFRGSEVPQLVPVAEYHEEGFGAKSPKPNIQTQSTADKRTPSPQASTPSKLRIFSHGRVGWALWPPPLPVVIRRACVHDVTYSLRRQCLRHHSVNHFTLYMQLYTLIPVLLHAWQWLRQKIIGLAPSTSL